MFNKESSAGLCPGKVTNGKGRTWTEGCSLCPAPFLPLPLGSCSVNVTLSVLMPKFQLQPHDLLIYKQKTCLVLKYELMSWIHPWLKCMFIPILWTLLLQRGNHYTRQCPQKGGSEEEVAQTSEKKPNVVVMNKISSPALIMEQNGSKWHWRPGLWGIGLILPPPAVRVLF